MDQSFIGSLRDETLDNFVYIVGPARGGTTIIRDAIGIHDQILTFPGVTHFMNHVWRYRKKIHLRLFKQIFNLPAFYRDDVVLSKLGEGNSLFAKRQIEENIKSMDLRRMWINYPLVYALDTEYNNKKNDKISCWVEKANDCYKWNDINKAFPKVKFIFIVRDPRATVLSLSKRLHLQEHNEKTTIISFPEIIRSCIYWRNMTQKMLLFKKKFPGKTLVIKFEDFVLQPDVTLNKIFNFLNVEMFSAEHLNSCLVSMGYRATNDPSEKDSGISRKPLERWKNILHEEELSLITQLTKSTATKLNYNLDCKGKRQRYSGLLKNFSNKKDKLSIAFKLLYLNFREFAI